MSCQVPTLFSKLPGGFFYLQALMNSTTSSNRGGASLSPRGFFRYFLLYTR